MIDESCGILVPPDDAQALAATLRHLLQDGALLSRLGAEGPTRARYLLCLSNRSRPNFRVQRIYCELPTRNVAFRHRRSFWNF